MGVTYVEGQVKGLSGKQENVKFLVDSGATYSLLPKAVWESIGLKPKRKLSFTLADGTAVERSVSEAFVIFPQGEAHTPVILGEEGDEALMGVVTLEILGLVLNPFNRTYILGACCCAEYIQEYHQAGPASMKRCVFRTCPSGCLEP